MNATGSQTLATALGRRALTDADRTFLIFEDDAGHMSERSYGEVYRRAACAANAFTSMGVAKGDAVHVHLTNCPEFFDCWFGAALMGAVAVPTNTLWTADELAFAVSHSNARITVTEPSLLDSVLAAQASSTSSHDVLVARADSEPSGARTHLFESAIGAASPVPPAGKGPAPRDVATIMYTSGTTSRPKGVCVTHANYLFVGEVVAQHLRMRPGDRMMVVLPLFHANAQYYSTMSALVTGSSMVVAERFSASRWSQQVARYGATLASLFAAPIRMILAQEAHPLDNQNKLRAVIFSQNVTEEQLVEFEHRFGCPLLQLYGMTETIAPPTLNPLYGERRNMSIGRPTLSATIRLVDEQGGDVAEGDVGELLVHGVPGMTLMAGYLDDPDATQSAVRDGWLHTGDNVRADEAGYLYFVDRAKDMIKRAGENVSASEVEAVINRHQAVFESAVVGVPDPMRDESVKAFVVIAPDTEVGEAELIEWCAGRLAKYKVPGSVEFVDTLPRTPVGKIQKEKLRERPSELK